MDFLDELEQLAGTAIYEQVDDNGEIDANQSTIKMWQERFGYTYEEAAKLMAATKSSSSTAPPEKTLTPAQARTEYVLKLEGPIASAAAVQIAGKLPLVPAVYHSDGGDGTTSSVFCKVDGRTKLAIENWISDQKSDFQPLFVPVGTAYKELSPTSLYPTLGVDTTLPQFRSDSTRAFSPGQDQYPVWYFFYGTLASAAKLTSLLSDDAPVLRKASVMGGKMETWGMGKYNALVNGDGKIEGDAYMVRCKDHEDALRKYETAAYEVVRCEIELDDGVVVKGCTFRFVGDLD